jgi:hypothetical protein
LITHEEFCGIPEKLYFEGKSDIGLQGAFLANVKPPSAALGSKKACELEAVLDTGQRADGMWLQSSWSRPMINLEPWSAQRRTLLTGFAALSANTIIGCNRVMAATVEQNTLKRQAVGLRAFNSERASPGFTLFAPHFVQNRVVYLIDLKGEVVHTWNMPTRPACPAI